MYLNPIQEPKFSLNQFINSSPHMITHSLTTSDNQLRIQPKRLENHKLDVLNKLRRRTLIFIKLDLSFIPDTSR